MKALFTAFFLCIIISLAAFGNSWTAFVENMKIGETAIGYCQIVPSGFDDKWEYYTFIVHSDTGSVYGVNGRAKPGVVNIEKVRERFGTKGCNVTAKLLQRKSHKTSPMVSIEVEISRASF